MDNPPRGVVSATPELAETMALDLSPEHLREIGGVSGLHPADAVRLSLAASVEAYAYVPARHGGAIFMMGVGEKSPVTGGAMVWMLGTAAMAGHPAGVLRAGKWGVARAFFASGADRLEQFIPGWYRTGLAYARRLGFLLSRTGTAGAGGTELWYAAAARPKWAAWRQGKREDS